MVIAWPEGVYEKAGRVEGTSPWKRMEKTQQDPRYPCLLVPQPAHAVLAGELAAALLPESFGELPAEIRQAISMHDAGWATTDAAQLQNLRSGSSRDMQTRTPTSFAVTSPVRAVEAWTASVQIVEGLSAPGGMIVSQHFTYLATLGDKVQNRFLAAEEDRRRRIQAKAAAAPEDLERWTAALGFCDLLSLYLLSGLDGPALFPLAHPASPLAANAPQVTLMFEGAGMRFTPPIFPEGIRFQLDTLRHPVPEDGSRTATLAWHVAPDSK